MGRFGTKGISVGVAQAISGLVEGEGHGEGSSSRSDGERSLGDCKSGKEEDQKRKRKMLRKKGAIALT